MTSEDPGQHLLRFGLASESSATLEAACEAAQRAGLPHGVSARSRTNRPDASTAQRTRVELYFRVHKTGDDPAHYTVELPHPVSDADASRFNELFGRAE